MILLLSEPLEAQLSFHSFSSCFWIWICRTSRIDRNDAGTICRPPMGSEGPSPIICHRGHVSLQTVDEFKGLRCINNCSRGLKGYKGCSWQMDHLWECFLRLYPYRTQHLTPLFLVSCALVLKLSCINIIEHTYLSPAPERHDFHLWSPARPTEKNMAFVNETIKLHYKFYLILLMNIIEYRLLHHLLLSLM